MDIAEFAVVRPLREVDDRKVRLTNTRVLTPDIDSHPPVDDHLPPPRQPVEVSWDTLPKKLRKKGADPLAGHTGVKKPSVMQRVYGLVRLLDEHLAGHDDRVTGEWLADTERKVLQRQRLDTVDWQTRLSAAVEINAVYAVALLGYRRALVDELSKKKPDYDRAIKLTRRALVAALFEIDRDKLKQLTRDKVFDRLNRWPLVLDGVTSKQLSRPPMVKLVREAKKADLYVVRREWAGYVAGEVANVRNLMAGEGLRQRDLTTSEVETTTTTEVETRQLTETEEESKLKNELSQEVDSQLHVTINGYAGVAATYSYGGMATVNVSGGVSGGFTMLRTEKQARKTAQDAVSRAVSRVDSRNREARTRRELMRTEQGYIYTLENTSGGNVHGVYRWVDRIDTYQTFKFPERLLLEFQIPDPAEFYRWRTKRAEDTATDKPPDWDLKVGDIATDRLIELAAKYHATNLPAPPDQAVSVVRALSVDPGKEWEPSTYNENICNPPLAAKELEIPIPSNYEAVSVSYEGAGYPAQAKWMIPLQGNAEPQWRYGYHSGFATVSIGKESRQYWNGGGDNRTNWSTASIDKAKEYQTTGNESQYGSATLTIGSGTGRDPATAAVKFDEPARDLIKIHLTTSGLEACTITTYTYCMLTQEAQHAWKQQVYDTLYQAWASWKRDYDSSQMRNVFGAMAADAGSTQRNEQTIREELKRETISWLLNESPFSGRPGRHPSKETDFGDVNFDKARANAPTIQFLEQAFEWNNMSWVFYPYYWTDRKDWPDRTQFAANDPEFERFLRSGSARVVLPARPGFVDAVNNWLQTNVPFISGRLPAPDEDLYIRIDTEIRELTSPWEGGFAGDDWQSRVSTTMLYLEEKGDLPFVNDLHQLPAQKDKWYTPERIITLP